MMLSSRGVVRVYLLLMLLSTLSASLIWGINTLFLLDAGLSNSQAFAANAFFTVGQLLFEIPTGIVADLWGRRTSYLLGSFTLTVTTVLYYLLWQNNGAFWQWAAVSALLGLGFTFFSGAVEAWLVDALAFTKHNGQLDDVFAKGQVVGGIAMLSGSVAGGIIAQVTNLGVPYLIRGGLLAITFITAYALMKDLGFEPETNVKPLRQVKNIFGNSVKYGLKNRPVRWLMLAGPFASGVGIYGFYAMQPYLLQLYGDPNAYSVAGLAAAIVAGAQTAGGLLVPRFRRAFRLRTSLLLLGGLLSAASLFLIGLLNIFVAVIALLVIWAMVFAAVMPVRQAYINGLIPSKQRATVLSFDNMIGSSGGVVSQPALGKVADLHSYSASYMVAGVVQLLAVPFIFLAKREHAESDRIQIT